MALYSLIVRCAVKKLLTHSHSQNMTSSVHISVPTQLRITTLCLKKKQAKLFLL